MKIRGFCTREHYIDHIGPIFEVLAARGVEVMLHVSSERQVLQAAYAYACPTQIGRPASDALIVVAGGRDLGSYPNCVLVEHGAGQHYRDLNDISWAGGEGRQNVRLFIVPNEMTAARNEARYEATPNVIAAPRLERLRKFDTEPIYDVVLGRHWDTYQVPELQSAWPHHFESLRRFAVVNRDRTAMHFHPRCDDVGRTLAREWGVRYLDTFDRAVVLGRVLVIDNSSVGFEWAALDRPVVWLNAPHYRRHTEHGLRFWSHVDVGMQVDDPHNLEYAIAESLRHDPQAARRKELIAEVFPVIDGSAEIAADAIMEVA